MMDDLIRAILAHQKHNDRKLITELAEQIRRYRLETEAQLKRLEDNRFTPVEQDRMTDEMIQERLYHDYDAYGYDDYMECSEQDKDKLDALEKHYLASDDPDERFLDLIRIYSLMGWDMQLPYHTYQYILADKLGEE